MKLTGLHHITMITGDAQRNVAFYADLLGLRFVKKTVNFDAPDAYHLYFGDEQGTPGSILKWFEFAGAARRREGICQVPPLPTALAGSRGVRSGEDRTAHPRDDRLVAGAIACPCVAGGWRRRGLAR